MLAEPKREVSTNSEKKGKEGFQQALGCREEGMAHAETEIRQGRDEGLIHEGRPFRPGGEKGSPLCCEGGFSIIPDASSLK